MRVFLAALFVCLCTSVAFGHGSEERDVAAAHGSVAATIKKQSDHEIAKMQLKSDEMRTWCYSGSIAFAGICVGWGLSSGASKKA